MAVTGRPSTYTQDIATTLCTRIAEGEPVTKICREEGMPPLSTVYRWLLAHEDFREQYTRAKDDAADTLADEIISIADEADTTIINDGEEDRIVLDSTAIARNRLRVDARKWVASKLKPKKYGDRITQEVTGEDGGPIRHEVDFGATASELLTRIRS